LLLYIKIITSDWDLTIKMIEFLKKLTEINSIFPGEKKIGEFLFDHILNLGFAAEKQYISGERFNILAEKGSGDASYLLYAHLDTVPVYGNWSSDPFTLNINGDRAIGLGAADMKGGIAAILKAAEQFQPKNFKLKIALGVDEENFSEGAWKIAGSGWLNDVRGIMVPESSLPAAKSSMAGATITLGRKGRAVFTLKIYGKAAHGVEPETGINAIEEGAKLITAMTGFKNAHHPDLGWETFFIRRFEGKTMSLSVPDYAEIEIDFHFVRPDTTFTLKQRLNDFISGLYDKNYLKSSGKAFEIEFSQRPTPFPEPFVFPENDPFIKKAARGVKKVYGEVFFNYGQSVADENIFGSLGIPTITLGPLADNHHCADEWVSLASLEKLAEIYRLILTDLDNNI
jgi:acetylornithine deacetylase/succinyl-diaminopimelate desuccinylase-like protein